VHHVLDLLQGDWEKSSKLQDAIIQAFQSVEDRSHDLMALLGRLAEEKRHYESPNSEGNRDIDLF
jgi:hypothetical protein